MSRAAGGARGAGASEGAQDVAEEAMGLARVAPARAKAMATTCLGRADLTPLAEATALCARGLAAREANDVPAARANLERAVETAVAAGFDRLTAEVRLHLSLTLASAGETEAALRQTELAAPLVRGAGAGRLAAQRALILQRLGQLDEALTGYRQALGALRRAGDTEGEARALVNRGILHAYRGELAAAETDLGGAERRYSALGMAPQAADVRHNLGFVASRQGDVPAALRAYDRADRELTDLGVDRPVALLDRCETLLMARLLPEARAIGEAAARRLRASGMEADLAEAELLVSVAALAMGDRTEARRRAQQARRLFLRQHRAGWAALAGHAALRSAAPTARPTAAALREARKSADELERAGWSAPATDARIVAGRLALVRGELDLAEHELTKVSRRGRTGPAVQRARAWHAEALLRLARGRPLAADSALRAGMRTLAQYQATLGATELRVHSLLDAREIGALGVRLALATGKPRAVLAWAERRRAGGLRLRPARPPAEVADDLEALRHVVSQIEEAGCSGGDTSALLRQQAGIEGVIRRKTWGADGRLDGTGEAMFDVKQLPAALGARALVEIIACDGLLHAVTVVEGRARLWHLGPQQEVAVEVDALRFALSRLADRRASARSRDAALTASHHAAGRVDELLLRPLAHHLRDRPLVIVPTGHLHGVPWPALGSCGGRPLVVAPSAALWQRAAAGASEATTRPTVLVAGPDLAHADREVADIAALLPSATVLRGPAASNGRVCRAIDGAGLVHVATHGRFRSDNPLFSSLQLADGPLTVYDLEGLDRAPARFVLSACDAGRSAVGPGDELMGISSALLCLGTNSVVASTLTVPDAATHRLMVELHRHLAAGSAPAEALAAVRAGAAGDDSPEAVVTRGFVCFGA